MDREHMDSQGPFPVETKFGEVLLTPTYLGYICVDGSGNGRTVVVNNVRICAAVHAERNKTSGHFGCTHLFAHRNDDMKEASLSAKGKISAEFARVAEEFADANPAIMHKAELIALNNQIVSLEEKRDKAVEELQAIEINLDAVLLEEQLAKKKTEEIELDTPA